MPVWKLYLLLGLGAVLTIGVILSAVMTLVYFYEIYPPLGLAATTLALCSTARAVVQDWLAGE